MLQIISKAISAGLEAEPDYDPMLHLTGVGSAKSCYDVAEFSQASVAAAVLEVQRLRHSVYSLTSSANVNRELCAAWSLSSIQPIGWPMPAAWDAFAGDYQCRDGWIRLHTNAKHHRTAALSVLDNPDTVEATKERVSQLRGLELESAVVAAGGAAAFMMSLDQWSVHEQGKAVNAEPVVSWIDSKLGSSNHICSGDTRATAKGNQGAGFNSCSGRPCLYPIFGIYRC